VKTAKLGKEQFMISYICVGANDFAGSIK